jgi:hypothetical protein
MGSDTLRRNEIDAAAGFGRGGTGARNHPAGGSIKRCCTRAKALPVGFQDDDDGRVGGDGVSRFEDRDGRLGHEDYFLLQQRKAGCTDMSHRKGGMYRRSANDGRAGNQPSPMADGARANKRFLMAT